MTTTPDTREGLLQQAREIAASFLDPKIAPGTIDLIQAGKRDEHLWVRIALAALSTATPPVDGEAKMPAWIRDYEPKSADPLLRRGDGEAKMREALQNLLDTCGANGCYDAREFAEAVKRAREALSKNGELVC